jgi:branched-chain amino acid transport system ATP-binding protein
MTTETPRRRRTLSERRGEPAPDLDVPVEPTDEPADVPLGSTMPTLTPEPPVVSARSPLASYRNLVALAAPTGLFPVLVLLGLAAVERFDAVAFGILAPEIRASFHLSDAQFVPISTLTGLLPLLLSVPLGYWADRTNRIWLSRIGGLVWGITAIITGAAPALFVLILARLAGGTGQLVNEVAHPSLLADFYKPKALAPMFSFYGVAAGAIGLVAGPLSGVLGEAFGWRPTFILLGLPTFVLVGVLLRVKEPARGGSLGVDEAALAAAEGETAAPGMGESYRRLRAIRSLRRTWLAAFFFGGGVAPFATYLSLFFNDVYHVKPDVRGYISALFGIMGLVGLAVGGKLAQDQVNRARPQYLPVVNGLMIVQFGVGIFLMAIAPTFVLSVLAVSFLSIGAAGFLPAYRTLVAIVVSPRLRSQAFAWSLVWFLFGALFSSVIVGSIGDNSGQRSALTVLSVIVVIGGLVAFTSRFTVRRDVAEATKIQTAAKSDALLTCNGLDVAYDGGVQVLFGVDFEVMEGQVIALLGTNGAGKSTLLRAISGLLDPVGGAIFFGGRDITHLDAVSKAAMGIVQVPGGRGVFPGLTVAENLKIAGWLYRRDSAYLEEATERVLGYFPILREYFDLPAANLSGGQQQMLTLAQALLTKPKLLMIDELSLGLAPVIVDQLLATVRQLAAEGTTIILVEQSVNVALTIADTAYFMEKGEVRFNGPTAELLDRPDVLRAVFLEGAGSMAEATGAAANGTAKAPAQAKREAVVRRETDVPALRCSNVTKRFGGVTANNDVSFDLWPEQILGIIGPNGAGKTTLFDLLCGYAIPDSGTVELHGLDITALSPDARAWKGLGRSFQDAKLFPALTVGETVALSFEKKMTVRDPLAAALNLPAVFDSEREVQERVDELIELMGLEAFRDKFVAELSTGSRRIVDLACILATEPKVILFDEPSSGIAQRETEALGPLLTRIREATGASLLVIEHDMPLITSISDEILALDLGAVLMQGAPDEVINDPRVVSSYLGTSEDVVHRSGTRDRDRGGDSTAAPTAPTRRRRTRTGDASKGS